MSIFVFKNAIVSRIAKTNPPYLKISNAKNPTNNKNTVLNIQF